MGVKTEALEGVSWGCFVVSRFGLTHGLRRALGGSTELLVLLA